MPLGLSYGFLTIGRGAPFLLSALIVLANLQNPLFSALLMLLYSQLSVLPILSLILIAGWKVKERLNRLGRPLDLAVGSLITVLAAYYILSALDFI